MIVILALADAVMHRTLWGGGCSETAVPGAGRRRPGWHTRAVCTRAFTRFRWVVGMVQKLLPTLRERCA
jgi:hypothetical protein